MSRCAGEPENRKARKSDRKISVRKKSEHLLERNASQKAGKRITNCEIEKIHNPQSEICNRDNQQSAINNQQSVQQSAISNQQFRPHGSGET